MRIFSGIRSSGDKTLGNYSGGFRQYVATQEQGDAFFCVVDLHSITTPFEPDVLHEATLSVAAWLFATGLDPNRSTVFVQSHVQAHAEAAWLLSAVTSWGELRRMTQFKDRAAEQDFVSAGLFNYPVLMAGDILLYQADVVPIGDDQRQHLELSRNIAERFNGRFGETFKVPEGVYPEEGARVKNLQEPERLMSTTRGAPAGVVRMIDPPDEVRKKFKTAVTDSGTEVRHDPEEKPGVSNLIEIMAVVTGKSISEVESQFDGEGYGALKGGVAEAVVELLAPIQERYNALRADEGELRRMLAVGADKAREASAPTLESMYERMGFVRAVNAELRPLAAILAVCVVTGVLHYADAEPVAVFVVAALALAGLAWVIGLATEAVGARFGPALTGVLQSTLGNLPELFVVLFALSRR